MTGVLRPGYTRVVCGQVVECPPSRRWTADDYDLLERLAALGLNAEEMTLYFADPPVTRRALYEAVQRAGIRLTVGMGRPSNAQRAEWRRIREERLLRESRPSQVLRREP